MFVKIVTNRMHSVIDTLVGVHQTYGIKNRLVVMNIHTACSMIECGTMNQTQVAMLQVDMEEAVDRVQHTFLYGVL